MKENNAAYNESGNMMKNIMVPYQTMSIDEIKEDAWGWCAKLVDGAMAQGQGPQSYVPLMLSAARLGMGVRSSLSAEEKELVVMVFGQLLNMTHEELFAIFCKNEETDYSRMLEGVSRLGNTIAIPFLHLTLCFAYADGKIEKELPQQLEQAFGLNLVADFFQSGQESVPDPPVVLNDLERKIVSWFLEDNTLHSLTDIQRRFTSESPEKVKQAIDALCKKDILFGGENIVGNLYGLVDDNITIQAPAEPELQISDEDHEKLVQISNMLDALENRMETMGIESDPTQKTVKETKLEFQFRESNRLTTERYSLIIPEGFTVKRNVDGRAFWAWLPDEFNPKDSDNAPILLMEGMFIPDPRGNSTSVQERVEGGIAALSMVSRLTGMDIDEPEEFHSGDIHGFIAATENIHYIGTVLLPEGNQQIRVQANSEQYQGDAARNLLIEVLKTVQIAGKQSSTNGSERVATKNTSSSSEKTRNEQKSSDIPLEQQEIMDYLGDHPNSTVANIADYVELSLLATTRILVALRKSGKVCREYFGSTPVYSLGVDETYYPDGFSPISKAANERLKNTAKNEVLQNSADDALQQIRDFEKDARRRRIELQRTWQEAVDDLKERLTLKTYMSQRQLDSDMKSVIAEQKRFGENYNKLIEQTDSLGNKLINRGADYRTVEVICRILDDTLESSHELDLDFGTRGRANLHIGDSKFQVSSRSQALIKSWKNKLDKMYEKRFAQHDKTAKEGYLFREEQNSSSSPDVTRRKTEEVSRLSASQSYARRAAMDIQEQQQEIVYYLGDNPNSTCAAIADHLDLSLHATTGLLTTLRKTGKVCREYDGKTPVYSLGVDETYYPDGFVPKEGSLLREEQISSSSPGVTRKKTESVSRFSAGQSNTRRATTDTQGQQQEVIDYLRYNPNSTCAAIADHLNLSLHATTGLLTTLRKTGKVCREYDGKTPVYSLGVDETYYPDGFVPKDESTSIRQEDVELVKTQIISILNEMDSPATASEIAGKTYYNESQVQELLIQLTKDGTIARCDDGSEDQPLYATVGYMERVKVEQEQRERDRKDAVLDNAIEKASLNTESDLTLACNLLASISGWKDADTLLQTYEKRLGEVRSEEKRRKEEEAVRLEIEREKARTAAQQKRKRFLKKLMWVGIVILVGALAYGGFRLYKDVICPANDYKAAVALYETGDYLKAEEAFRAMGDYKDAEDRAEDCHEAWLDEQCDAAEEIMQDGEYEEALTALKAIDSSRARELEKECLYLQAAEYYEQGDLVSASSTYGKIEGYKDANQIKQNVDQQLAYEEGIKAFEAGNYEEALNEFNKAGSYSDAAEKAAEAQQKVNEELYAEAGQQYASGNYKAAYENYKKLGDYLDSKQKAEQASNALQKQEEAAALRKAWDGSILFNSSKGGYFVFDFEWGQGASTPTVYFSDAAGRHQLSVREISQTSVVLYDSRGVTHTLTKSAGQYSWRWESTSGIRFD